ncbi:uncharacterized protein V2V93DRAFT_363214 [Kockiozyma suomiensis]|uniref:uncharacterized protein n=1 Tax=Kockiozyma suomiensis TaxID=1337062 RepID=UPI003343DE3D
MDLITISSSSTNFTKQALISALVKFIPKPLSQDPAPDRNPVFIIVGLNSVSNTPDSDILSAFTYQDLSLRTLSRLRQAKCYATPSILSFRAAVISGRIQPTDTDLVIVNLIGAHVSSDDPEIACCKALFDTLCYLTNFLVLDPETSSNDQQPVRRKIVLLEREEVCRSDTTLPTTAGNLDQNVQEQSITTKTMSVPDLIRIFVSRQTTE